MSQRKIVFAEDEPHIAMLVQFTLEAEGFDVEHYDNGSSVLERLLAGPPPTLVVLDMMMPGVSGLDVLAQVKADARYADVPVLIVSARAREVDRNTALASGASAYLTKPFSTEDLSSIVVSLADRAAERDSI